MKSFYPETTHAGQPKDRSKWRATLRRGLRMWKPGKIHSKCYDVIILYEKPLSLIIRPRRSVALHLDFKLARIRGYFHLFVWIFIFTASCCATETINTSLSDVNWTDDQRLSLSRTGTMALAMENLLWQHAESEHFIYHFIQKWMAERAACEAETYYSFIKKDLKISEDRWEKKGQVFVFESDEEWKSFTQKSGVDRWSGGFCSGNEIFLLSPPRGSPFIGSVLPHELTHLIINRFVRGQIPIWLNEGVAEQQARRHFSNYTRPKGYSYLYSPNVVSAIHYIPLEELTLANDYPEDEKKVGFFYSESLRLVQFLVEDHPKQDFLEFLQAMADGMKFANAFDRIYGSLYPSLENFEPKFKEVAISKVKLIEE